MAPKDSCLAPLSDETILALANHMFHFFLPCNLDEKNRIVGTNHSNYTEWTLFDFIQYLQNTNVLEEALLYSAQIHSLARKLVNAGILNSLGLFGPSPIFHERYFCLKELTALESKSDFWLGGILGERYLQYLTRGFIVRIEGTTKETDKTATGSGVLVANNKILTCAHNIRDINISSCWRGEEELTIIAAKAHPRIDLGIIEIMPIDDNSRVYPYLGNANILDKTLTMGYPPARGMRGAPLIAQSGEINAIENEIFSNAQCITISSTTRPGNSGGPVFSMSGYIVGIVISSATAVKEYGVNGETAEKQISNLTDAERETPFYLALSSHEIKKGINEIDPEITLQFETYEQ